MDAGQDFRGHVRSTSRPGLSPVGLEQYRPTQQLNKAISYVSEMEMNEHDEVATRVGQGLVQLGADPS